LSIHPEHIVKALLLRVAAGDEKAFEELFYSFHNRLGSYVMGWTKSETITEEIVQDVFLKIWLNRETLAEVKNFENYLFILSRNHTFNSIRQAAKERLRQKEWLKLQNQDEGVNFEDLSDTWKPVIDKAIELLPLQQKKVYLLKREEGLKYEEIALRMGISPETARKHLQLAMRSISNYVKAHHLVLTLVLTTPLVLT
jgi:RNA polymerase sigma-70 factor (ECF subfamily)